MAPCSLVEYWFCTGDAVEVTEMLGQDSRIQEIRRVRPQRVVPGDAPVPALFEPNWQLTALGIEVPVPDATQFTGMSPCPRKWHSVPIKGQPSTLPIVEVVKLRVYQVC